MKRAQISKGLRLLDSAFIGDAIWLLEDGAEYDNATDTYYVAL